MEVGKKWPNPGPAGAKTTWSGATARVQNACNVSARQFARQCKPFAWRRVHWLVRKRRQMTRAKGVKVTVVRLSANWAIFGCTEQITPPAAQLYFACKVPGDDRLRHWQHACIAREACAHEIWQPGRSIWG